MKITDTLGLETSGATRPQQQPTQQQEFLRLLVAQLQHQNPLDPQDGSEFVAQLAQFSSLEQATEANARLETIAAEQAAAATANLASFVGRDAVASARDFSLESASADLPPMTVQLDEPIESGEAVIKNAAGEVVRTIKLGPAGAGTLDIPWDDKLPVRALESGRYHVEVTATTTAGDEISKVPRLVGTIDSLELGSGQPRLRIGDLLLAPGDVLSIN